MLQENYTSIATKLDQPRYTTNNKTPVFVSPKDVVEPQVNNISASYFNNNIYNEWITDEYNKKEHRYERAMIGPPNPDTMFNLYIEPKAYDGNFKPDQFVTFESLNKYTPVDLYGSGYVPRNYVSKPLFDISQFIDDPKEKQFYEIPTKKFVEPIKENYTKDDKQIKENYDLVNNYKLEDNKIPSFFSCGYAPKNKEFNMPINYQATPLQQSEQQKELNKNIFTMRVTPTLYNQYEVSNPVSSNMGISYPVPKRMQERREENGKVIYTSKIPIGDEIEKQYVKNQFLGVPTIDSIYDSKNENYGPSYRSYEDPISGSMKYYYDDIDAIKYGTILTDNKIDIFDGSMNRRGVAPGPMYDLNEMRKIEQNRYLEMTNFHRDSMQTTLMEKMGDREWQVKIAPTYQNK